MNILKIFGSNVRRIREQYGLSQDHLADESGLHRTYISGIERGIRNPTLSVVAKVSQALNVAPEVLLAFLIEQDKDK